MKRNESTHTEPTVRVVSPARSGIRKLLRIPTPVIFGVSILLAVVLLWWQGSLGEVVDVLRRAEITPLLIATPIYLFSVALLCLRWHQLVYMAQGWSDLPAASEAFLTSIVINYAAPVGLAVPSRAALTKRALGLDGHSTGTIALWEVAYDLITLAAGTVLWLFLAEGSTRAVENELRGSAGSYAKWGAIGAVILVLIIIWFLRNTAQRRRFVHFIGRIMAAPMKRPGYALQGLLTSVVYWILQGVVLALIMKSMQVEPSFVFILGLTTAPIMLGMFSPTPGGSVVREALMYVVARLADQPGNEVVTGAVIYRMALFGAIPILYGLTRLWISRRGAGHPNLPRPEAV